MRFISFIYNGYYYFFADSKLSSKPDFSAWVLCTLATIFYVAAVLTVVGKLYNDRVSEGAFPFGIVIIVSAIAIGLLSDWNIQHTWFGATNVEMHERRRVLAKSVSLAFLLGSWLAFISANLILYA